MDTELEDWKESQGSGAGALCARRKRIVDNYEGQGSQSHMNKGEEDCLSGQ